LKVHSRCGCNLCTTRCAVPSPARCQRLCHRPAGPMGRLVRRLGGGQRHHPRRDFCRDRRLARLADVVVQQTLNPASAKRCCHRHTVGQLTRMPCATRCAECRSAEASTMRSLYVLARPGCGRPRSPQAARAPRCSKPRRPVVPWPLHLPNAMASGSHILSSRVKLLNESQC
jgi:hypothetical protein